MEEFNRSLPFNEEPHRRRRDRPHAPRLDADQRLAWHVGGSTAEAQENIGIEVASKLVRYSDNGSTLSAVNFPEVSLPGHPTSRRLLHIHRNIPGVLSRVNEVFSKAAVNIDGQYLQTSPQVGYVVIDVTTSEEGAVALRNELAAIEGTLRARVLY